MGTAGQQKLKDAKVVLVGVGGLGAPAALYLAASGIGTLGLVDFDDVDLTNLHRQVIHHTLDAGRSKLQSASEKIRAINPNVRVVLHDARLTSQNALEVLGAYDLVIDGGDNFPTRYLVNDACVLLGKRNMYGSIYRFEGQATVFCASGGPCYRCLFPSPPPPGAVPSCAEAGVLGVLPGVIGLIQATEAIKTILGVGESLAGRLLLYDALDMRFSEVRIQRDPTCPMCGDNRSIHALIDYEQFCGMPVQNENLKEIDARELKSLMQSGERFTLVDVREPDEFEASRIPGSVLIPLGTLADEMGQLDPHGKLIIHCQKGGRSARACALLSEAGFEDVSNLKGGIEAWMANNSGG